MRSASTSFQKNQSKSSSFLKNSAKKLPKILYHRSTESLPYRDPTFDERIVINVRGKRYETYAETLNGFPDTLLGSQTSRLKYLNQSTNELVLNGNVEIFEAVLFYYQSRGILGKLGIHFSNSID